MTADNRSASDNYEPVTARFIVGDSLAIMRSMPAGSVDCIVTSPPYLQLRAYLPPTHPAKALEVGQEDTPGDFLEALLTLMDEAWRVLSDDGTFWINLGDTHAGSGGAGGDYAEGGLRDGQQKYDGTAKKARAFGVTDSDRGRPPRNRSRRPGLGWPLDQSVCWVPHLFGASLAYGRNILTGDEHQQWVTRPAVTWCKPNPMPGSVGRKFKTATELIVYGGKHQAHYWDIDPVREPLADSPGNRYVRKVTPTDRKGRAEATDGIDRTTNKITKDYDPAASGGRPPLNYWVVQTERFEGAHFATFPPSLITKPIIVGCPRGGTVLDPFAGSGTTVAVATGHGRSAIGIDLDERNAWLARDRVGMWLITESFQPEEASA